MNSIKNKTSPFLFASLSLFACGSAVNGQVQNWNQFRGPESNPVSENKNLPDQWSLTENVEWSSDIPGRGWSSPIVWNDKVFVTTVVSDKAPKPAQVGTDYSNQYAAELAAEGLGEEEIMKKLQERDFEMPEEVSLKYMLLCLDLATGKQLWSKEYHQGKPPGGRHRKNSFASETPTTDGQHVYIYVANLGVYAFDFAGNKVWSKELKPFKIYLDFGTGSSPILVDNKLIILNDNEEESQILAFDKKTGEVLWDVKRGDFPEGQRPLQCSSWTTPYLWKNSQRTEIVTIGPGKVVSYDLDGKELWSLKGMRPGPASSPFAVKDQLIINGGPPAMLYSVQPGASGELTPPKKKSALKTTEQAENTDKPNEDMSGNPEATSPEGQPVQETVTWSARSASYIPTPVAYDGGLYMISDNGIFARLSLNTGEETFKKRVKTSGADFTVSPWAYNGKVFLASEQGSVYVFEAGEQFNLLHTNEIGEMAMATPAIVGDRLLFRTEKRIISIRKS